MEANEALGCRWMASKHWGGWRVGMRCQITGRVCVGATPSENALWHCKPGVRDGVGGGLPDLDHPGTRAFLLEDVRKAWGPESYVDTFALFGGASCIRALAPNRPHFKTADHDTESEALIAALEAAPE